MFRFGSNACTGHMYGNIGQVSCLMSTLMGGVSGSAVADASMECRILGPEMNRLGYDRGWSAAINGLSGLIVATIPPSMGLIIYGTVGEVSIGRLFMAGWVPGILMVRAADAGRHLEHPPLRLQARARPSGSAVWDPQGSASVNSCISQDEMLYLSKSKKSCNMQLADAVYA